MALFITVGAYHWGVDMECDRKRSAGEEAERQMYNMKVKILKEKRNGMGYVDTDKIKN